MKWKIDLSASELCVIVCSNLFSWHTIPAHMQYMYAKIFFSGFSHISTCCIVCLGCVLLRISINMEILVVLSFIYICICNIWYTTYMFKRVELAPPSVEYNPIWEHTCTWLYNLHQRPYSTHTVLYLYFPWKWKNFQTWYTPAIRYICWQEHH